MEPFSNQQQQTIFHHMRVINGSKHFGVYDHFIAKGQQTEAIEFTQGRPHLSLVLPVMDRAERLQTTLSRLLPSLERAQLATEIVVMDNSLQSGGIFEQIKPMITSYRGTTVLRYLHHYDPRLTFPTTRNYAVQELSRTSEIIASWDSDIYCSAETFSVLISVWKQYPELAGIAPPLGSYTGGNIDKSIRSYAEQFQQEEVRRSLHMPGAIGEDIGVWNGRILQTALMRGAFCVKRSLLEAVAAHMPEQEPWSRDLVVWSNVLFFILANELDAHWGYAMEGQAIVVHDERPDHVAMGTALPMRDTETLKALLIICYRHHLDEEAPRLLNKRFLTLNLSAISRVTSCSLEQSSDIQNMLLALAAVLRQSDHPSELARRANATLADYEKGIGDLGWLVIQSLCVDEVFERVKGLQSLDLSRPIYSIQANTTSA
jgi:hypothetical protein